MSQKSFLQTRARTGCRSRSRSEIGIVIRICSIEIPITLSQIHFSVPRMIMVFPQTVSIEWSSGSTRKMCFRGIAGPIAVKGAISVSREVSRRQLILWKRKRSEQFIWCSLRNIFSLSKTHHVWCRSAKRHVSENVRIKIEHGNERRFHSWKKSNIFSGLSIQTTKS